MNDRDEAHARPSAAVLEALGSSRQGLDEGAVTRVRSAAGWNELAEAPPEPRWRGLLRQFNEPVIWLLVGAALLSGALGEWTDAVAIIAIVILNGVLGFTQEERAGRALAALKKLAAPVARVVRAGAALSIPARELVPGDVLELEAGATVPADARLLEAFSFRTEESALTGESAPVEKHSEALGPAAAPLAEQHNMVFAGTSVVAGKGLAVVVATGMKTQLGQIVGLVQRAEREPTPLQRKLAELGRVLLVACGAIVGVIFLLQVTRGARVVDAVLLAVSLAVAAVPEGLPAVVTIALALGLQRMLKRNALIRKLPSVETLGAVTVICSDKTGTLTRNEMTVRELYVGGERYSVTGEGFEPEGRFFKQPGSDPIEPSRDADLLQALTIAARANDARVARDETHPWHVVGDPTEGALVVAAMKGRVAGANAPDERLGEIPFSSERKAMSVVVRGERAPLLLIKGAPEVVLSRCHSERVQGRVVPLTDERRAAILRANASMAERALRVLGLGYREDPRLESGQYEESELTFSGLVGMIDPPRVEAKAAVQQCRAAGIRPVMITGDHPVTALAIARELGIAATAEDVLTGVELTALSDAELAGRVEQIAVYARVSAEHKLRVVSALKARGHVVAMTGDGVNDAPALKAADVGVAMGIAGTDAAKEAAAVVLTDDNFASIVNAVEEGREVYDNIQKAVFFLISANFGEVLFVLLAASRGLPSPLEPIHLLWINLVTDGLPAIGLGFEPPEPDTMQRPPRPPREPVITRSRAALMVGFGLLVMGAAAAGFELVRRTSGGDMLRARTAAFSVLVLTQLFASIGFRSFRFTMPELGPFSNPTLLLSIAGSAALQLLIVSNPWTAGALHVAPLGAREWAFLFGIALVPVTIVEVGKIVKSALGVARRGTHRP